MTMISPIRYEVEIQLPLSTPVPMPPSMLSNEALVIWMFRIAMNAPIMAAITEIQTVALARSGWIGAADTAARGGKLVERARLDMTSPLGSERHLGFGSRARGIAGDCQSLDGRDHRHARAQIDRRVVIDR